MKTFRILGFALVATLLCLSACSGGGDDPIDPTPKPEVVKSEITIDSSIISNGLSFTNEQGEQSISFTTNESWTLSVANTTSGATWCTASATSGTKGSSSVKFTITENTDYEDRSVSVTIKSGTASKTFTISQKGVDALLLTTDKYEVNQEGGTIEVEVKANIDYQLEISEDAKDWIKESSSRALTTKKHQLEIAMNEESEKREGEVYFKSGDKVETVKVYQAGGSIIMLSQNEYTVSDAGDTISVEIKSNVEYGVQMPDVDWIVDEASSRGLSSHTLKYIVKANEEYDARSASIVFYDKNSDLKDTLKVAQTQKDAIVVAKNEYTIESVGGDLKFEVNTNVDFEVSTSVDWIKQKTESRGLEATPLNFTIDENTTEEAREGIITISSGDLKQEIKVVQKTKSVFSLSETEFNITSDGGEFKVEVSTNGEYTITMPEVDWLSENENRATSSYVHTFTVLANETYDAREAEIVFTHKETEEVLKVKVVQAQKDAIIIAKSEYVVDAVGGDLKFEVNTNVDFEVSTSVDWIKQNTESRGLEATPLSFTIAENTTEEAREGVITISSGDLKQEIKVVQKTKSVFSLSETEFNLTSDGGEFKIEVSTNGEYTITMPEVDWLSENESRSATTYTHSFTVLANETYDARETEIVFTHKETEEVLKVKVIQVQKNAIVVSDKNFSIAKEGETIEVKINTNVDVEVQIPSEATWITQVESRGLVEKSIYLKVAENTDEQSRSAKIVFANTESQLSETIEISQAGTLVAGYVDGVVTLTTAGTLKELLGDDFLNITSLKVVGRINGDDVRCLRQMMGGRDYNLAQRGKLITLDLSKASIVEGGSSYYGNFAKFYTSNGKLGDYMFFKCDDIQEIILPTGITSIGEYAFCDCYSLVSIDIPASVTSIGASAFSGYNSLTSVYITDLSAWCNIAFENSVSNPLYYDDLSRRNKKLYVNNKELTELVIPEDVKQIPVCAFFGCKSLTKITISDGVASIGDYAFYDCVSLASINIPDGVTSVGNSTFQNCSSLASINIPDGVTSVGASAFEGCSSLMSITLPAGISSIGDDTFEGCSSLTTIEIPLNVTSIGTGAFYQCSSLTSIEIPSGVTSIGVRAFDDCSSLTSIEIPSSVTSIGYGAFRNCKLLTSINIPTGVKSIDGYTFYNCRKLASIDIPTSITSIGEAAFVLCSSLTAIDIPASVTSIGDDAFSTCSHLNSVHITDLSAWCNISFDGDYSNPLCNGGKLYLNDNELTELVIPAKIERIKDYTFYKCRSVTKITIESGVTSVGIKAFNGCTSLTSLTLGTDMTSIGKESFRGCSSLKQVNSFATTPPVINTSSDYSTFSVLSDQVTLNVPKECGVAYEESDWSKYFKTIVEME